VKSTPGSAGSHSSPSPQSRLIANVRARSERKEVPTAARRGILPRAMMRSAAGVLGDPMLRSGHALIAGASLTQVIGVAYWIIAARIYPVAVVGRNSAALSIMLFLSGVAELNMMSTLVRFLPTSGTRTVRLILAVYATSTSIAAVIGAGFLYLIPHVEPQLAFVRTGPYVALWFVFSIMAGTIFVLEDSALTGVRSAPFVPLENTFSSVLKLALMIVLVRSLPSLGIYVSSTVAVVVAVFPTNVYLFGRAVPRHLRRYSVTRAPPRFREIGSFLLPDSAAALFLLGSTALLPVLIIDRLGAGAAGHYALAWIVGYALFLVSVSMGSSLVVETAADQSQLRQRCLRSITHLAKLLVPVVAVVVVAAPYLLLAFGHGYAQADVTPLRLLALAALPALVTNTAISVTRSLRRMRMVVGIQVCMCTVVWGLSVTLIGRLGITGVAAAWLTAQTVTALTLVIAPRLWLPAPRRALRHGAAARQARRESVVEPAKAPARREEPAALAETLQFPAIESAAESARAQAAREAAAKRARALAAREGAAKRAQAAREGAAKRAKTQAAREGAAKRALAAREGAAKRAKTQAAREDAEGQAEEQAAREESVTLAQTLEFPRISF
jgi:O-antigen/teichoic acid export membrane protein